jgi:ankyrin repeat protein
LRQNGPSPSPSPQTLLDSGAKVNSPDVDGWLPLHVAAYYGAAEISNMLLQHSAVVSLAVKTRTT